MQRKFGDEDEEESADEVVEGAAQSEDVVQRQRDHRLGSRDQWIHFSYFSKLNRIEKVTKRIMASAILMFTFLVDE